MKNDNVKFKTKKIISVALVAAIIGGGIFAIGWYFSTRPEIPQDEIISRSGIHWHPAIEISILGKRQEIPAGIGLGMTEKPIHTHEKGGVIHLEFPGFVKKDDVRLGKFFEIWGKRFDKDCVFDKCAGPEGKLKMLVNGKENFEFENYAMQDQDQIEIIFGVE